ncbi:MAG: hypothetical protein R3A49_01545 [Acidimicrobiia bacterium]
MSPDTPRASVPWGERLSDTAWRWATELRIVAFPWVVARILTVAALVAAEVVIDELSSGPDPVQLRDGLLGWDADWYKGIAGDGYGGVGEVGLRFWPLFPLLGRGLSWVLAGNVALALLIIANVSAAVFMVLLRRLVLRETGDEALAMRAVWLSAIWPMAFVLVMGYAEALFLALAVGFFLCIRSRRWLPALALGILAGLTRPFAIFLVIPAAVEVWRVWKESKARERLLGALAVLSSGIGIGVYLLWVQIAFSDMFLPLTLQSDPTRQGSARDPVSSLLDSAGQLVERDPVIDGLHALWGVFLIALLVIMFRRLPLSYGLYSAATLLLALSTSNLDSLERYAMGAFPFFIATAMVTREQWAERTAVSIASAALAIYALLAFTGIYTP